MFTGETEKVTDSMSQIVQLLQIPVVSVSNQAAVAPQLPALAKGWRSCHGLAATAGGFSSFFVSVPLCCVYSWFLLGLF